jgi:putative SOS response-associated peptidase YedK
MFREAYAQSRCIVPVDGFFEWCAIRGARAKQPYAIAVPRGELARKALSVTSGKGGPCPRRARR